MAPELLVSPAQALNPTETTLPKRVLIVDDRDEVRELLVAALDSPTGELVFHHAADGERALEALRAHGADLVVTDLDMPVMNGIELIRRLRKVVPSPPIVIISGASSDWISQAAADEIGELPFLRKPLDLEEVVRVVREQLAD